jgi:hypothetical protein
MPEELGFGSWKKQEIFLFFITSRPAVEPTQPPIQWVPGAVSLGVNQQRLQANNSL